MLEGLLDTAAYFAEVSLGRHTPASQGCDLSYGCVMCTVDAVGGVRLKSLSIELPLSGLTCT